MSSSLSGNLSSVNCLHFPNALVPIEMISFGSYLEFLIKKCIENLPFQGKLKGTNNCFFDRFPPKKISKNQSHLHSLL